MTQAPLTARTFDTLAEADLQRERRRLEVVAGRVLTENGYAVIDGL